MSREPHTAKRNAARNVARVAHGAPRVRLEYSERTDAVRRAQFTRLLHELIQQHCKDDESK